MQAILYIYICFKIDQKAIKMGTEFDTSLKNVNAFFNSINKFRNWRQKWRHERWKWLYFDANLLSAISQKKKLYRGGPGRFVKEMIIRLPTLNYVLIGNGRFFCHFLSTEK